MTSKKRATDAPSHEGFPNPPERYPNLSERNPSRLEQIPNPVERNPNSKTFNFLRRIEPYQGVTPTPRHFAPLPALKAARVVARSPRVVCSVLRLRFGFLRSRKQAKGWRHFLPRIAAFQSLGAPIPSDFAGREPHERKPGEPAVRGSPGHSPGIRGPGKRQGDG